MEQENNALFALFCSCDQAEQENKPFFAIFCSREQENDLLFAIFLFPGMFWFLGHLYWPAPSISRFHGTYIWIRH